MWGSHARWLYFSDTIARNIALDTMKLDIERVKRAAKIANIQNYIESLPLQYNTKIGRDGHGLSLGQKQRILIARAVYKILIMYSWMRQQILWMPIMKVK